jgi:hypothetical protein
MRVSRFLLLCFVSFSFDSIFASTQTAKNKHYNEKIAPSDKTFIDLFAPHTGLSTRPTTQWDGIENNKDKICSTDICPKDRQINCYRGVPDDVNGCQATQRERLSNFVNKYIKGTWSKDGIPGISMAKPSTTTNTLPTQKPVKEKAKPQQSIHTSPTNVNPADPSTFRENLTQGNTGDPSQNNGNSLNPALSVAAGAAGVLALSTVGGNNDPSSNSNTGGIVANPNNPLVPPTPVQPGNNPIITGIQTVDPNNRQQDPAQQDNEIVPPNAQPALQSSQKCTVEWAKEIGTNIETKIFELETKLISLEKQLLGPIVVPEGQDPKTYQAAQKVKRALQLNVVKRNLQRLKLLKQLFINQLMVANTSTDLQYQKSHLFLSKEQYKLYSPKDKASFPVEVVRMIDQFNTCAMSKKTTKEINVLIGSLLASIKQQEVTLRPRQAG